jgi:hypothetical protein
VLVAARICWPIVLAGLLAGVVIGSAVGLASPSVATVLLQVSESGSARTTDAESPVAVQTAMRLIQSESVVDTAARTTGVGVGDLAKRLAVTAVSGTSLVTVAVTDDDGGRAVKEVDAVARAALDFGRTLAEQQYDTAKAVGNQLVEAGKLLDPEAEQSRRRALGTAVAGSQAVALTASSLLLTQIGTPQGPDSTGLPVPVAAALGGLLGLGVGLVIANVLVGRRGHVRRVSDVTTILKVESVDGLGLTRVASRCAELTFPLITVLALPGSTHLLDDVIENLERDLHDEGVTSVLVREGKATMRVHVDRRPRPSPRPRPAIDPDERMARATVKRPAFSSRRRATDLAALSADALVVAGESDDLDTVARVRGLADCVVVLGQRSTTRYETLRRVMSRLGEGDDVRVVVLV